MNSFWLIVFCVLGLIATVVTAWYLVTFAFDKVRVTKVDDVEEYYK
jgi:hypothetical protein